MDIDIQFFIIVGKNSVRGGGEPIIVHFLNISEKYKFTHIIQTTEFELGEAQNYNAEL